jgi:hypothetical protein
MSNAKIARRRNPDQRDSLLGQHGPQIIHNVNAKRSSHRARLPARRRTRSDDLQTSDGSNLTHEIDLIRVEPNDSG